MRVCAVNGTNVRVQLVHFARAQSEFLLGQHDDAAAFRVSSASEASCAASARSFRLDAGRGMKRRRHAIAQRDRAGLVEQQHIHVARRFHRASAHRQHVALKHAIHAGDADGAEQSADRRRNQADQQRDQNRNGKDRRRNKCRTVSASRRPAGKSMSAPPAESSARFR